MRHKSASSSFLARCETQGHLLTPLGTLCSLPCLDINNKRRLARFLLGQNAITCVLSKLVSFLPFNSNPEDKKYLGKDFLIQNPHQYGVVKYGNNRCCKWGLKHLTIFLVSFGPEVVQDTIEKWTTFSIDSWDNYLERTGRKPVLKMPFVNRLKDLGWEPCLLHSLDSAGLLRLSDRSFCFPLSHSGSRLPY